MDAVDLLVRRTALTETHIATTTLPALTPGQILARIDKFALTANNVSYAVTGDMIGYWGFFPPTRPGAACRSGALRTCSNPPALKSPSANACTGFSPSPRT